MLTELVDGTKIELFEVGTRVRRKDHPEFVGTVMAHEIVKSSGKLSALPYKVYWDDEEAASRLMGSFSIYPLHEMLEAASG